MDDLLRRARAAQRARDAARLGLRAPDEGAPLPPGRVPAGPRSKWPPSRGDFIAEVLRRHPRPR